MSARIPWIFTDPFTAETYSMEVNPNEFSETHQKKISFEVAAAPGGKTLVFEGNADPVKYSVSGTLLTEAQYNAMMTWYEKRVQIQIQDDLGRTFTVYITSFSPTRKRSTTYPWRHTWNADFTEVNW
jgi:hypothetical protein